MGERFQPLASLEKALTAKNILASRLFGLIGARFGLAAFLLPLAIRAIPDLIAGPYPIGYDTIGSYVPMMLDWGSGNFQSFNPMIGGWLTFAIFGTAYWATHADPVFILKIAGPILYGFLGFSEYFFARGLLKWDMKKSLLLVLIASTYFVSLRMSLDLFRNTLGISLLLITLTLGQSIKTNRRGLLLAALIWLVSVTHLLVGGLLLAFVAIEAFRSSAYRLHRILCMVPAVAQISLSLVGFYVQGIGLVAEGGQSIQSLSQLAFPLYIFLPLIPVAAFGLKMLANGTVKWWLLCCGIGLALAAAPISTSLVLPYRWALMMTVPIAICATEGSDRLRLMLRQGGKLRLIRGAWMLALLLLGGAYLALPTGNAFPYFGFFSPPSMLQSTVPLTDSSNIVNAIGWLSNHTQPASVLMTHNAFYGWARLYFHGNASIVGYSPDVTLQSATHDTIEKGYSRIYTLWWTDNSGTVYYQQTIPSGFVLQHQEGRIGVFLYVE